MDIMSYPLAGAGFAALCLYGLRLNAMMVGRHLTRCIVVQAAGLLAGAWVFGSSMHLPAWGQWANFGALLVLLAHLGATSSRWPGSRPPREAETRPGDLGPVEWPRRA